MFDYYMDRWDHKGEMAKMKRVSLQSFERQLLTQPKLLNSMKFFGKATPDEESLDWMIPVASTNRCACLY